MLETSPRDYEDSVTRIASDATGEASARGVKKRFVKQTYTLIDGPNSGQTVEFWAPAGTTVTSIGSATPGDAVANPTTAIPVESFGMVWDATQWRRDLAIAPIDARSVVAAPARADLLYVFNGATFDRVRSGSPTANPGNVGVPAAQMHFSDGTNIVRVGPMDDNNDSRGVSIDPRVASITYAFNGTSFDRLRAISAADNTAVTSTGAQQVAPLGTWAVTHAPADNTQAVATKAAGGTTTRHVCTGVSASVVATGASTAGPVTIQLVEDVGGTPVVLQSWKLNVPATIAGPSAVLAIQGLNITASANKPLSIISSAAGGANTAITVNMTGYTTP